MYCRQSRISRHESLLRPLGLRVFIGQGLGFSFLRVTKSFATSQSRGTSPLDMRMRAHACASSGNQGRLHLPLLQGSQSLSIIETTTMVSFTALVLALPSVVVRCAVISNTPSLILPGSGSNTTNTNNSNAVYRCNGPRFGYNLDWRSCTEALSQIDASSTMEETYGPRFKGPFDVKLPKRYISCSFLSPSSQPCVVACAFGPNRLINNSGRTLLSRICTNAWQNFRSCKWARNRNTSRLCYLRLCQGDAISGRGRT